MKEAEEVKERERERETYEFLVGMKSNETAAKENEKIPFPCSRPPRLLIRNIVIPTSRIRT